MFHAIVLQNESSSAAVGVAYADRSIGEIDPEAMIFLDAAHSPSGKPGVMFAGAWSGTMSFWEFQCPTEDVSVAAMLPWWSLLILPAIFASA